MFSVNDIIRSSHPEASNEKVVPKHFAKLTGKHLFSGKQKTPIHRKTPILNFSKVAGQRDFGTCNFLRILRII